MSDEEGNVVRHPFITLPRIMDDGSMTINVDDIMMVCDNADENGIIEGTAAIYLRDGPGVAVNMPHSQVIAMLLRTGWIEERNFMPRKNEETVQ